MTLLRTKARGGVLQGDSALASATKEIEIPAPPKAEPIGLNTITQGNCLDLLARVPSGSVDMVLCDLPYGTTQNKWDSVIPFAPLWEQYRRVCKPNAAIVLTAAQPFTSVLTMSNLAMFRYGWVWEKQHPKGFLDARRRPLRSHEDICVFYSETATYNPQGLIPVSVKNGRKNKSGNGNYGAVAASDYVQKEGNFPRSVLKIDALTHGQQHPTQKPVALFEYLIRTYTNPGEVVLDNCCGSGTTGVACQNTGRNFIQMELDPGYCEIARSRLRPPYKPKPKTKAAKRRKRKAKAKAVKDARE